MDDWQPIETAPKDGTRLLLWSASREAAYTGLWQERLFLPKSIQEAYPDLDGKWCESMYVEYDAEFNPYRPLHDVTRWQPLPLGPVEEAANG